MRAVIAVSLVAVIIAGVLWAVSALPRSDRSGLPQGLAPPSERPALPPGLAPASEACDRETGLPLEVIARDGARMVLVPAGPFLIGSEDGRPDERPIRKIVLAAYYIDVTEVTLGQFRPFVAASQTDVPDWVLDGDDDLPASAVTYYDAAAYARWAGKRLPTEAQWEKAARPARDDPYPWGSAHPRSPEAVRANALDPSGELSPSLKPVGSYPEGASPYGCLDLAGNVWEWCADWYRWRPPDGPDGPPLGTRRVIRGGSSNNLAFDLRASARGAFEPFRRGGNIGFRCVVPVTSTPLRAEDTKKLLDMGYSRLAERRRCEAEDVALSVLYSAPDNARALDLLDSAQRLQPPGYAVPPDTPLDPDTSLPLEVVSRIDGAHLMLIPAGEFAIGSEDGYEDEAPEHVVTLDTFYMDATPVTNARWQAFMDAVGQSPPFYWTDRRFTGGDRPVVGVTYDEAITYARWAGRRLPTEAEWEKAARGPAMRLYPWGNDPPDHEGRYRANYLRNACTDDTHPWTSPVGAFPEGAGPYGCLDQAGNVWEWCADWYAPHTYRVANAKNPQGPATGSYRVLRGGAFHSPSRFIRTTQRFYGRENYPYGITGLRLAATP